MKDSEDRLISLRRSKVADMLAKGYNQVEIAKACVVSEPMISRDVEYLRTQAAATLDDYIANIPLEHAKARTACDLVLRYAFEVMDDKTSDQRMDAAKLILSASEFRLAFIGDITALDKWIKQTDAMKKNIAELKKKTLKPAPYEVRTVEEPASGRKGATKRVAVKVKKEEPFTPVV